MEIIAALLFIGGAVIGYWLGFGDGRYKEIERQSFERLDRIISQITRFPAPEKEKS